MNFGNYKKHPSNTRGMIRLMLDYEEAHGQVMPVSLENSSREYLYIRDDLIANTISSHGKEIEF